jgi:protein SCO1
MVMSKIEREQKAFMKVSISPHRPQISPGTDGPSSSAVATKTETCRGGRICPPRDAEPGGGKRAGYFRRRKLKTEHPSSLRSCGKRDFRQSPVLIAFAFVLAAGTFLSSCTSHPAPERYHFTGEIVSIDAQNQSAVINGDNVPGFMDPMTMTYKIKPPSVLNQLHAGDLISADVVVIKPAKNSEEASDYWLENVKTTGHVQVPPPSPGPGAAQRIPQPGELVPDFSFTNQYGRRVWLKQYRGKVLLVTFIYTRCPFPDFCPRMSSNLDEIYKQVGSDPSLESTTSLLTLSFDPDHDTPKVLREYAFKVAHTQDPAVFNRWGFGVPQKDELPKIADFFGVIYKSDGGLITHNLSTTVIGPDGKILKWYHGNDWQVSDLIADAKNAETKMVAIPPHRPPNRL